MLKKDKANSSTIYSFETDYKVEYELVFKSDAAYLPKESLAEYAYSAILIRVSNKAGVADPRIRDTVIYGLQAAFDANPNLILTYTCSTDNNQEKQRALLFRRWFLQCGNDYQSIDFQIVNGYTPQLSIEKVIHNKTKSLTHFSGFIKTSKIMSSLVNSR